MDIRDVLTLSSVCVGIREKSKKRVLEYASRLIERQSATINENELFAALITREKLGCTAVGNGLAVPHCQLSSCVSPAAAFIRLEHPVDFGSSDRLPVDLFFVYVVPRDCNSEHMKLFKEMVLQLKDPEVCRHLRELSDARSLYELVTMELIVE